ncbi:MAG: PmeII family type II restriction endonuclease [Patescibacteria group bacterium]
MIDKTKEEQIKKKIIDFIERIHEYENLDASEIVINPFLAEALKLQDEKAKIKFFLTQRLQRGMVTSFGTLLQEIVKILDSDPKIEDIDLAIIKNGRKHYVQLKSGPEGFTRPALRKTKQAFRKLKLREPDCVTTIAFSYGAKAQLSPIWGKEVYKSADIILVGEEFWDYFFGEGFYDKLLNIFRSVQPPKTRIKRRKSFDEIFETVYTRLLKEGG